MLNTLKGMVEKETLMKAHTLQCNTEPLEQSLEHLSFSQRNLTNPAFPR